MKRHDTLSPGRAAKPVVIGAGLIALDVLARPGGDPPIQLRAGGTCGNVLTALSYLGWGAWPVSRLKNDPAAESIRGDLARWSVKLDFVSCDADGSTPVFVQNTTQAAGQDPVHTFTTRCPACGARLPGYKAVTASGVESILPQIAEADVFFFDRASRGTLLLAGHCAALGAIVVFEPSGIGEPRLFQEAVAASHVLKYSNERLKAEDIPADCRVPLLIETRGREGLRFRSRLASSTSNSWVQSRAFVAEAVQDTSGAGDWCSAGLLHALGRNGAVGFLAAGAEDVTEALRLGQALSAWNCGFGGARGGMYEVTPRVLAARVTAILEQGRVGTAKPTRRTPLGGDTPLEFCALCATS